MANEADLKAALEMIRDCEKVLGEDPFAPREDSFCERKQVMEHRCWGCDAQGESRWPDWKLKMEHKPDCKWLAYRRLLAE